MSKKAPMITDSNQTLFAKMSICGLQDGTFGASTWGTPSMRKLLEEMVVHHRFRLAHALHPSSDFPISSGNWHIVLQ